MRRYIGYALITIAILTGIVWGVSQFIQPILPAYFNNNLILVIGVLFGVVGLLAQLKDVVELFKPDVKSAQQETSKQRNEFSITGPVQINYGDVTNITLNITYLVPSQDKSFTPLMGIKTEVLSQETIIPRQTPPPPREFIGRYQEITALKRILLTQSNKTIVTGLIGMGGIGKTTLASAVANDPEIELAFPDGTLWTSLYESKNTQKILVGWIKALGYSDSIENLEDSHLFDVFQSLVRKRRLLIVVDGADKDRLSNLDMFIKTLENSIAPNSRMLITSREINLKSVQMLVSLDVLPENEAVKLFERNLGRRIIDDDKSLVAEIVFLLGYHPLAIAISSAHLKTTQMTLSEFRDKLREELEARKELSLDEVRTTSIKQALNFSYDHLTISEQTRLRVLFVFSNDELFDHIATSFVWHVSQRTAKKTLISLYRHGFITANQQAYNLHPLIQSYVQDLISHASLKEKRLAQQGYKKYLLIKNTKRKSKR